MDRLRRFYIYNARWLFLFCVLVLTFGLFSKFLRIENELSNPNLLKASLAKEGYMLELPNWEFKFQECDYKSKPAECSHLSLAPVPIQLPNPNETRKILTEQYPQANLAVGEHLFSEKELAWIERFKGKHLSFVIPNSLQFAIFTYVGKSEFATFGRGVHVLHQITADKLIANKSMRIEYEFDDEYWFGPLDLSPALIVPEKSGEYLALREKQINTSQLVKQIYIGFPLLIAAIALVLDHSLAMALLSVFGAAQALRSFLSFLLDSGIASFEQIKILTFSANGLSAAMLILLALEIAEIRIFTLKAKIAFVIFLCAAATLFQFLGPLAILQVDSMVDCFAAIVCFSIICFKLSKLLLGERKLKTSNPGIPNTSSFKRTAADHTASSRSLRILKLTIVGAGFAIHGWANASDLILIEQEAFRNFLDWRQLILFPALISGALLEVGSTSRKMFLFAREMVTKALIEKELEVGQDVQQRMLPEKRAARAGWSWRSAYIPATALAGDWYDIREINFRSGEKLLVACIADVTGHGVGAALATSVISSHWGLWCEELSSQDLPSDAHQREELLAKAPARIDKGLLALRKNENCTAIFCFLNANSLELNLCSAAHPGALISNGKTLKYLTSNGGRLGVESEKSSWNAVTTILEADEFVVLYSDGIIPVGKTVSGWAAMLKRELRKDPSINLSKILQAQVRANYREFRNSKEVEDDMTLLAISLQSQTHI